MKSWPTISRHFVVASLAATLLATPLHVAVAQAARTYEEVTDWAQLPPNYTWQDMMAVDIDSRGDIYVLQRTPSRVMVFNSRGRYLRSWGDGLFPGAHGLRIDRQNNVWVTDRKRHQVLKFTRDGALLMELGTNGVPGDNDSRVSLNGPADVAVGPNGDIFVADGESTNTRIVKFSAEGRFLMSWGSKGSEPGQLLTPHSIVLDSGGRVYVANRGNKRIEIFDRQGGYLGQIATAFTPYGLFLTGDGIMYAVDGADGSESLNVLNPRNGRVLTHITGLSGSHMVTVDRTGAIYVAQVRGHSLRKFVRK
jgi:peptidylamidoglycolate lyase